MSEVASSIVPFEQPRCMHFVNAHGSRFSVSCNSDATHRTALADKRLAQEGGTRVASARTQVGPKR